MTTEMLDRETNERAPTSGRALAFLALAVASLIGQYALVGAFLVDNGLDLAEVGDQVFSSTIAALTFTDLMACTVIFYVWMPREAARTGIQRWWMFAVAGVFGGLCFAFGLFLYFRERSRIEGAARARPAAAY